MQLTRRLTQKHDMVFGRGLIDFARDSEATAQNVRTRLLLLQGEWFMDTSAGVPYLQRITPKPMDLTFTESVFKQTILETDGVARLLSFSMSYASDKRNLTVQAKIQTVFGTVENIQVIPL